MRKIGRPLIAFRFKGRFGKENINCRLDGPNNDSFLFDTSWSF